MSESEPGGSKINSRTGRPDWAVQASFTPLKASRPPAGSDIKPSAQTLGNARGARDLPGKYFILTLMLSFFISIC